MAKTRMLFCIFFSITCLCTNARPGEKDRSGPAITLQSNVYQVGKKWYCPLCRQEVAHGDRSGWDLKLCLSEWHDVLIEKEYF